MCLEVMKSEMNSIHVNQVWTLVDPLKGIIPIRSTWVYKRNIGSIGEVVTYKARLVVNSYS